MKFLVRILILPAILLINSCPPHRESIGMPIKDAQALALNCSNCGIKIDGFEP